MQIPAGRRVLFLKWLATLTTVATAAPVLLAAENEAPSTNRSVTVIMRDDMRFYPEHVSMTPGDTIIWINEGAMPHTATDKPGTAGIDDHNILPPDAEPWDSGLLQSGERFAYVFTVAGDYTYLCVLHELAGMVGKVTVK